MTKMKAADKLTRRILALFLSTVLILTMLPTMAFAENGAADSGAPPGERGTITAFATLAEDVAAQTITAFDGLPDELRWQNTLTPDLPKALSGTAEGISAQIPVTWEADPTYDADLPVPGLYVFTAVPGEGYALADGAEAPRITAYIPARISLFRMGSGTAASPLEIATTAQLEEVALLVNTGRLETFLLNDANAKASLKLINDIDLSGYTSGEGWTPIGTDSNRFKSSFDGGGHTITGLTINRSGSDNQGLFGVIGNSSAVKNLGVVNVSIVGQNFVGGIAGYAYGTVQNCSVSGSVNGKSNIGGVVGIVGSGTMVQNCYSTGSISGSSNFVGGVTGAVGSSTIVQNCYSIGSVSGTGNYVGGVAGFVSGGATVENSAALNSNVAGNSYFGRVAGIKSAGAILSGNVAYNGMPGTWSNIGADQLNGASKTASEVNAASFFQSLFGNDTAWTYKDGKLPGLFGAAVDMPTHIADKGGAEFLGDGTSENPWQIRVAKELARLAELINAGTSPYANAFPKKHYKLMNDLDLSDYASGEGWVPIGHASNTFKNIFEGAGHKITGLTINRGNVNLSNHGLFGYLGNGVVKDLGLVNVNITVGGRSAGGVAGIVNSGSTIENCSVTGNIAGQLEVGGVAGIVYGTVKNCYSAATVAGTGIGTNIGGITGLSSGSGSKVENCLSTGAVSGANYIGGIVGELRDSTSVKACAALNLAVTGSSNVGRVTGSATYGNAANNVAFDNMSGTWSNIGSAAKDGADMTASQMQSPTVWSEPSNWGGSGWDESVWTLASNRLPGLFGAALEIPPHITETNSGGVFWGVGIIGDPYQIRTAAELAKLAELVNAATAPYSDAGKYYKLMNDLDLSGYTSGEGWVPIGTDTKPFRGQFDGNGKIVSGLIINRPTGDYQGLFGGISNGAVSKLGVANASITGRNFIGGVVGYMNGGTVESCFVTGSVNGTDWVGGITGSVFNGIVQNCYSTCNISGHNFVGGVAGEVTGSLQNCYATGRINSSGSYVGGVIGNLKNHGPLKNSVALNTGISAAGAIGRVAGSRLYGLTLAGNAAFSGIPGTWNTTGTDKINGASITLAQINTAAFWTTAANWDTSGWDEAVWTIEDGKLPILKNVGGAQSGDGGLYLAQRDITHAAVQVTGTYTYTGSTVTPNVTVTFDGKTLGKDVDYTVFSGSVNAGAAAAAITGIGNFTGSKDAAFTINKAAGAAAPSPVTGNSAVSGTTYTYTIDAIIEAEYRMDSGAWQDSNEFVGIVPDSSHTFYARIKETANKDASAAGSTGTVIFAKLDERTPPAITGPTTLILTEGYSTASTGDYTITGTAPVTVSKTSGDAKITWNDTTKKLDIATGLAEGSYPVTLAASNGTLPDATLSFTLTVNAAPVAPAITGPTTLILTEGYSATSTGEYTITGTAPVTVSKASGDPRITWNDTTKKLDIATGLTEGSYPVTLAASNGTLPNATLSFTLTVSAAPVAPAITGPTTLILTEGYSGTSTGEYTITGTAPVTVSKTSGDARITWNDTTKKLDIATGLTNGSYPVTLTASNGTLPDATLSFTLTVSAAPVAPAITGPTTLILAEGYNATSTGEYTITGTAPVTVSKTSGDAKITWNDTTKKLDISTGLTEGSYPVTLTASNGTLPDATLNFTLTVNAAPVVNSATISPTGISYDLNSPADVVTSITWNSASMVTDVVYGITSLPTPDVYAVSGSSLVIKRSYLNTLGISEGDEVKFNIIFDKGDSVTLAVNIVDSYIPASNADLKDLTVNGFSVNGFNPNTTIYNVELSHGTASVSVGAIPEDAHATAVFTQAPALPGDATVVVTAEDKTTTKSYTIHFTLGAAPAAYRITLQSGGSGTVNANVYSASKNTEIILSATPDSGYRFREWQVMDGGVTITDNKFIMPDNNVTVKAIFEQIPAAVYQVTVNGSYAAASGAGSYTEGVTVTINAGSRSNYTFSGWTSTGGVNFANASSTATTFTMPSGDVTVTASWSYSGGSGGSSGSGDSGSPASPTPTIAPDKRPDQPVVAAAPLTPTVDKSGKATVTVPFKTVADIISKAAAEADQQGKTADGIGVSLKMKKQTGTKSLDIVLTQAVLKKLIESKAQPFEIDGSLLSISFDLEALKYIQSQSSGDVTVSVTPVTGLNGDAKALIGTRPVCNISINYMKNGKTVSITSLGNGIATLSIPYTPGKKEAVGYLFGVYVDGKGKATRIDGSTYDRNSKSIIINSNHFSVYGVGYTAPSAKFTDIGSHWGKESIDYVAGRGLFAGTSKTTFSPNAAVTRQMLVTALGRLADVDSKLYTTNSFTDVKADSAFRPYIEWADKKGIVQGIGNNQFAPDRAITREEIAIIFANYVKATGYTLPVTREAATYADASFIGSAYKAAVTAMQQAGIMMGGQNNKFNPKASATRAEFSAILHRYIKLTIDPATAQGWALNDDGQYLYYKDGKALTGWQTIEGTLVGWQEISSGTSKKRYYFTGDALMVSGKWLEIDKKWYYFNTDGSLAVSTKIDGYEVDENGVRKTK
jgi:uncharacterized repeat protein (TIGR02543 family)